jgi:single-strand DNA-binding protein
LNTFNITGNLTADGEIKQVGDSNVINFSIANNDESKKKDDGNYENIASFFNCTYWSKTGKMVNHLKKGKTVSLSGKLKQERWEKDGVNHSRVTLRCNEVIPHVYESAGYDPATDPQNPAYTGTPLGEIDNNEEPF